MMINGSADAEESVTGSRTGFDSTNSDGNGNGQDGEIARFLQDVVAEVTPRSLSHQSERSSCWGTAAGTALSSAAGWETWT